MDRNIVRDIVNAFRAKNPRKLRKINDEAINEILKDPNETNVSIALMSYVLSKIVSKRKFFSPQYREHISHLLKVLENTEASGDVKVGLIELQRELINMEEKDPRFVFDMITKGKVKIAATLYAKGMSLSTASKIMGIAKEEVLSYAGKTMMFDRVKEEKSVKERIREAEEILG